MTTISSQDALSKAIADFRLLLSPSEDAKLPRTGPTEADILQLTTQIDSTHASSRLSRKRLKLSERVVPFAKSLQQFSEIVGSFVQTNPELSGLIWGSIQFVLLFSINFFEYFEKLSAMFQKLGCLCPALEQMRQLFPRSLKLQDAVLDFYTTTISFCHSAVKFLKSNGLRKFAKILWKPFKLQFEDTEVKLQEQRATIEMHVNLASETAAAHERLENSVYRIEGRQHRQYQVENWLDSRNWRLQKDEQAERKRRDFLLHRISTYDYQYTLLKAQMQRHKGTCLWLYVTEAFASWFENSDGKSGFWLHGIPGAGKSILTSGVIEHILTHYKTPSPPALCYFFCDFTSTISLEPHTVLRSFLKQFVSLLGSSIPKDVEQRLDRIFQHEDFHVRSETTYALLAEIIPLAPRSYFVLDGLDECSDSQRHSILAYAKQLSALENTKVWLSSRQHLDMESILGSFEHFSLGSTASQRTADMQLFIQHEVAQRMRERSLVVKDPKMGEEICKALINGSAGMFLWVQFQLDDICKENTDTDIRRVLRSLPRDLNETYDRIVARILKYRNTDNALKIIQLVTVARESLSLGQLRELMALRPGDSCWADAQPRLPTSSVKMLQDCETILSVIETQDGSHVQFVHYTALEYLRTASKNTDGMFHFRFSEAEHQLARLCLTYLSLRDFQSQVARRPVPLRFNAATMIRSTVRPMPGMKNLWWMISPLSWMTSRASYDLNEIIDIHPSDHKYDSKFVFLNYAVVHWHSHCSDILPEDVGSKVVFESMALGNTRHPGNLPWEGFSNSDDICTELPFAETFKWSIMNDHPTLLRCVLGKLHSTLTVAGLDQYFLLRVPGYDNLLHFLCSGTTRKVFGVLLRDLDLPFQTLPSHYYSVLQYCIRAGSLVLTKEVCRFLKLEHSMERNLADSELRNFELKRRISTLTIAAQGEHLDILKYLFHETEVGSLAAVSNVKVEDGNFELIVNATISAGALKTLEWLLHFDPAIYRTRGRTPAASQNIMLRGLDRVLLAHQELQLPAAEVVVRHYIGPMFSGYFESFLTFIVRNKDLRLCQGKGAPALIALVRTMIKLGADVKQEDASGHTALYYACMLVQDDDTTASLVRGLLTVEGNTGERLQIAGVIDAYRILYGGVRYRGNNYELMVSQDVDVLEMVLKDRQSGDDLASGRDSEPGALKACAITTLIASGRDPYKLIRQGDGIELLDWMCTEAYIYAGESTYLSFDNLKRAIIVMVKAFAQFYATGNFWTGPRKGRLMQRRNDNNPPQPALWTQPATIANICRGIPDSGEIIQTLHEVGIDIDQRDKETGRTALMDCCEGYGYLDDRRTYPGNLELNRMSKGVQDIITALLRAGADPKQVDSDSSSMLMQVCRCIPFPSRAIASLVSFGADVNYQDQSGHTALYHCCTGFQSFKSLPSTEDKFIEMIIPEIWSTIASLVENGADINETDRGYRRQSVLMLLLQLPYFRQPYADLDICRRLAKSGLNIDYQDGDGNTLLIECCSSARNFHTALTLIGCGADINLATHASETALMRAVETITCSKDRDSHSYRDATLIMRLLGDGGPDDFVNHIRATDGYPILIQACKAIREDRSNGDSLYFDLVLGLLKRVWNPAHVDDQGRNAWKIAQDNQVPSVLRAFETFEVWEMAANPEFRIRDN